jgi:hypothetical protein
LTGYLETDFLVSPYTAEANSAAAIAHMRPGTGPFPLTSFCELELTNAIELRVFCHEITAAQAKLSLADLGSDVAGGVFHSIPTPTSVYEEALRLARRHTAQLGTRTLDILHVAAALKLGLRAFYTFDRRQAQLARAAGLATPMHIR